MKFAFALIGTAAAVRDAHPTINLVATNSQDFSDEFNLRELTRASLAEVAGDFHQPNVVRINYETAHANLMENIVRESISADAPYEEGEIGLNLIPAGASAASLKQLMDKTDAEFETEFRAGLHASLLQSIRIRLPKGGFKAGQSLISDDGRIAVRVLPARHIPGSFTEASVDNFLSMFAEGKISKQQLKDGALSSCVSVMKSEGSSQAMKGKCGSVITHLTNTPVASSTMDAEGGNGHVTVVLPSPSRVYGA